MPIPPFVDGNKRMRLPFHRRALPASSLELAEGIARFTVVLTDPGFTASAILVVLFLLLTLVPTSGIAIAQDVHGKAGMATPKTNPSFSKQVDILFAKWARRDTPGGALVVLKDGKIIYERGYGMANLEYGFPNTPTTIFHVASISKQFTAFSIHLLAQESKLSLDDDVRKYLPELHEFGKTITIRHLLHHTSGLRDQWGLVKLAGCRWEDVITEQDILDLVWRQSELNYTPGDEFLYCNTGYALLGEIVKRVSGRSLREFTQDRIFDPLGMNHTHFHDDYQELVANRAYSCHPYEKGGYQHSVLNYSNVGATGLFTTAEDLARWDDTFYNGSVGGPAVLAEMVKPGRLDSGKELDYASGLEIGTYRGLKTVEHSGEDAGFRADLLRFPEQRFSVIVLGNSSDMDESGIAHRVADVYLASSLTPVPAGARVRAVVKPTEVWIDPRLLDAYVGDYQARPGFFFTITKENDRLAFQSTGNDKFLMFPSSDVDFFMEGASATVTFVRPKEGNAVPAMILHEDGSDLTAERKGRPALTLEEMPEFEGEYYSEDGGTVHRHSARWQPLAALSAR
jgi:CubicO group peptidase (beta-lactamase class C family)